MEITNTLYVPDRSEWRKWLAEHHATEPEIWLVYYKKATGKPSIPYNDAVEEALCFGWIDGIYKTVDAESNAQRFTPRRPKSNWSQLNKERVKVLIERGQMTEAGLAVLGNALEAPFEIPADILEALQANPQAWENFERFPEAYKRIRIGYIADSRSRPDEFKKRLANFLRMTAQNKRFGSAVPGE